MIRKRLRSINWIRLSLLSFGVLSSAALIGSAVDVIVKIALAQDSTTAAPLQFVYDTEKNGYVASGMDRAAASGFTPDQKQSLAINIPATYDDKLNGNHPVVAVGERAFAAEQYSEYHFVALSFEQNSALARIEDYAFNKLSYLDGSLIVPSSVISIGDFAFEGCGLDGELVFADNSTLEQIGNSTFSNCHYFKGSLSIPASVVSIGDAAFKNCDGFDGNLVLENDGALESIGSGAFYNCRDFVGSFQIPDTVSRIGKNAFTYLNSIKTVYLPDRIDVDYEAGVFLFSSFPVVAANETQYQAFAKKTHILSNCDTLTYVIDVTFDADGGVMSGSGAQKKLLNFPLSYEKDPQTSVWEMPKNMTFPESSKEGGVFNGYTTESGGKGRYVFFSTKATPGSTYYALYADQLYEFQTSYSEEGYTINGFTTSYLASLANKQDVAIEIPATFADQTNGVHPVVAIEDDAFKASDFAGYTFTSLTFLKNSNLKVIGYRAFYDCSSLVGGDLVIPDGVTTIKGAAFKNAGENYHGSLVIPASVTLIEESAFYKFNGKDGTLQLPLDGTLATIPSSAFYSCHFKGDLVIPDSVTSISASAFSYCRGFDGELKLSANLQSIGDQAFAISGFHGVLTIPNSVATVGSQAFSASASFDTIYLPNNSQTTYGVSIFPSYFSNPIIAASQELYDSYLADKNYISNYKTLTYQIDVSFDAHGGVLAVPAEGTQPKLFNYSLSYVKDAQGIYSRDDTYHLPVVTRAGYTFKDYLGTANELISKDTVITTVGTTFTAAWSLDAPTVSIATASFTHVYDPDQTYTITLDVQHPAKGLTYHYRWFCDSNAIDGAVSATYQIRDAKQSGRYAVQLSATDEDGLSSAWKESQKVRFTVQRADFDVSNVAWDYQSPFSYDGTDKTVSLIGLPSTLSVSYSGTRISPNPGSYTTQATYEYSDHDNYYAPAPPVALTWVIDKAKINIEGLNPYHGNYDGQDHEALKELPKVSTEGSQKAVLYFKTDDLDYSQKLPSFTDAGKYEVYLKVTAPYHDDYLSSFTVIIGQATNSWSIEYARDGWIYGNSATVPVEPRTVYGTPSIEYFEDQDLQIRYTGTFSERTPSGKYYAKAAVTQTQNYQGLQKVYSFTIAKREVTVSIGTVFSIYGGNLQALQSQVVSGSIVNGDDAYALYCRATANSNTGFYDILGAVKNEHYRVTFTGGAGAYEIRPATISDVSISGYTNTYDGRQHEAVIRKQATVAGSASTTWKYKIGDGAYSTTIPQVKDVADSGTIYFIISAPNHRDYTGSFEVTIHKSNIDMSGITFIDKTVKEDGQPKTLTVQGSLPEGVSATYSGTGDYSASGVSQAGIYVVTVNFSTIDPANYNPLEVEGLTATLTIRIAKLTGTTEDGKTEVEIGGASGLEPGTSAQIKDGNVSDYSDHKVVIGDKKQSILQVTMIELLNGGSQVQPDEKLTIKLLIKEELRAYDNLKVLYLAPDGSFTDMHAERVGDYMVFDSEQLSTYAIAAPKKSDSNAFLLTAIVLGSIGGGLLVVGSALFFILKKKRIAR